jgi:uncharacterized membrane protein
LLLSVPPVIVFLYYLFEWLQERASAGEIRPEGRELGVGFGYAASTVVAVLLWIEVSRELVSLAWLAVGLMAIELGLRGRRRHVRGQGYYFCVLAIAGLFLINLYDVISTPRYGTVLSPAIVVLGIVALYYLFWRIGAARTHASFEDAERIIRELGCHVATALLIVLCWKQLDSVAVALAWGLLGLVLFEVGDRIEPKILKAEAHVLMALAFGRLFMANLTAPGEAFGISHLLITVLPIVAMFYYLFARLREGRRAGTFLSFERQLDRAYSYGAAALLVALARFELGRAYVIIAWAPLMIIYLALGVERGERDFRFQSYIIALLGFARLWATNIFLSGSFYGIPERFAITIPAVATFLGAALYAIRRAAAFDVGEAEKHWERSLVWVDKHAHTLFAILGSGLISVLLYHEVGGNLLTIAWAVQGLVLVALGITVYERGFRLYSLALLLVCVLKLVFIDLEGVETLYRIVSYIVLGLVLLAASFAYTRYREAIGRYI